MATEVDPLFTQPTAVTATVAGRAAIPVKKPLNAYMAFRTYYSSIFPNQQQKERSGFLAALWSNDTYHAHWTLIARVFSIVRDTSRFSPILKDFLQYACPPLGIVPPVQYLNTFNWFLQHNAAGTVELRQSAPGPVPAPSPLISMVDLFICMVRSGFTMDNKEANQVILRLHAGKQAVAMVGGGGTQALTKDQEFALLMQNDPITACARLLGIDPRDPIMQGGVNVFRVPDARVIPNMGLNAPPPDIDPAAIDPATLKAINDAIEAAAAAPNTITPLERYEFADTTMHLYSPWDDVLQHEWSNNEIAYDIGNPFHVDFMQGIQGDEGLHTGGELQVEYQPTETFFPAVGAMTRPSGNLLQ